MPSVYYDYSGLYTYASCPTTKSRSGCTHSRVTTYLANKYANFEATAVIQTQNHSFLSVLYEIAKRMYFKTDHRN